MSRALPPDPPSPFDDEQFLAELARMGVTHRPGLAQEVLTELNPLLKDEGIDLDAGGNADLDALDGALQRAVERHNLELSTPTGRHRDLTLAVLRRIAELQEIGDDDEVHHILDLVGPDPSENAPSAAQVMGVGLGLLDDWFRQSRTRRALATLGNAPGIRRHSAAGEVVEAARRKRAFATTNHLLLTYGGHEVLDATAIAVAAALKAIARATRTSLPLTCARLLIDDAAYESALEDFDGATEDPLDIDGPLRPADAVLLDSFTAWLDAQPEDLIAAPDVASEIHVFGLMLKLMDVMGLEPLDRDDTAEFLDRLHDMSIDADDDTRSTAMAALATFEDYTSYRAATTRGSESDAWAELADSVNPTPEGPDFDALVGLAEAATSAKKRGASQAATTLCRSVGEFLAWLGTSRQVTASGWLRLADIEPVAAMLGVRAAGSSLSSSPDVSQLPLPGVPTASSQRAPGESTRQVRSMANVPILAAWWSALQRADIVEIRGSRVRPGPAAHLWLDGATPTLGMSNDLLTHFIELRLTGHPSPLGADPDHFSTLHSLLRLESILWKDLNDPGESVPDPLKTGAHDDDNAFLLDIVATGTRARFDDLISLGLLGGTTELPLVPPGLGAVLARGAGNAYTAFEQAEELYPE